MDSLAVLARLARQTQDEESHGLLVTDQAIAVVHDQLAELHAAAERERRAACALPDGSARLIAYLRRLHGRTRGLEAELHRLEQQRDAQAARVAERHVELKRLEILIERRAERAHVEHMRREQRAIDDRVAARALLIR